MSCCCCSLNFQVPKALPFQGTKSRPPSFFHVTSIHKQPHNAKPNTRILTSIIRKQFDYFQLKKTSLAIQVGALLATTVDQPAALAVTGVNNEEDLTWVLIQLAIVAFGYFLVMPPIIMNWLRVRWYKRNVYEMYLQFMFVFIFFPGVLLWAPFLNFRKFPRDPSLKYPWSTPKDPSKIKNAYLKYPFAKPEDYEVT